jgi:hypothetical protein
MDFLSNLEKVLVILSPEIGESYFQKAEGRIPPKPPARAAAASKNLLPTRKTLFKESEMG